MKAHALGRGICGKLSILPLATAALLLLVANPGSVHAFDTQNLKTLCEAPEGSDTQAICVVYFLGFRDALITDSLGTDGKVCIVPGKPEPFVEMFLKFLKDDPTRLRVPVGLIVRQMYSKAYPCK